jgi:SpoIIAA-like
VIEPIPDMSEGVVGLRSSGKLTREDYTEVLEPALKQAIEAGGVRLLFVLDDFEGAEPGAWIEDVKTGLGAWAKHHGAWKRFALLTDIEWVVKATRMFAWLAPGEVRTFGRDELEAAKDWVAG